MAVRERTQQDAGGVTAELYRDHGPAIFGFTLHKLGRREDAEDATQATFANAYSALSTGTTVREPRAWLFQIARHECLARATDRRQLTTPLDDEWEPADAGPTVERQADVHRTMRDVLAAMAALPETQRDALVLREWSGLSTAEVAEALGTTVSSVDALLHRARRTVLASVAGHEEAAGCRQTRDRIDSGRLDLAARAHLVRCAECRSLRKQLLPAPVGGFALVPPAILAERLGDLIPGFAAGGGAAAVATAGGGGIAAMIGKLAALPAAAKVGVAIAGSAVVAGTAVEGAKHLEAPKAPSPAAIVQLEEAQAAESTPPVSVAVPDPIALTESSDDRGASTGDDDHSGPGGGGDDRADDDTPGDEDHSGHGSAGSDDGVRVDEASDGSSGKGSSRGEDDGVERKESSGSSSSGKGGGGDAETEDGSGSGSGTSGGGDGEVAEPQVDHDKRSGGDRTRGEEPRDDSSGSGSGGGSGGDGHGGGGSDDGGSSGSGGGED